MLVWKGWGVLTFIIPIICGLLMQLGINYYFGEGFYKSSPWPIPLAIAIAAIMVFFIGYKLNNKQEHSPTNSETKQPVTLKTNHSLFGLPMQYWSGILLLSSALMYFAK